MKSVKGTRTEQNLLKSFAGESQARNRYTFAAAEARKQASRLARLKKEQEELEAELDTLNAELYGDAASDYVRAAEISARIEEIENRLLEIYEETGI